MNKKLLLVLLSGVIASCAPEPSGISQPKTELDLLTCESMNGTSVHCGYKNPEDLVLVPGGDALIVSELGGFLLDPPGELSMLNLGSGERQTIMIDWTGADMAWGDESCGVPDIAAFSPHGIDLITRPDGRHQLLVVNHGKREAVEFFELHKPEGRWSLIWRGCALPPGDPYINDVAALKDGGFYVTHMFDKSIPLEFVFWRVAKGEKIGWVWEWQRDSGFHKLAGSDLAVPNGIAVSADNSKIYVNDYLGNKTVSIDPRAGEISGSVAVQHPDNVTVDDEGYLWIASHTHDLLEQSCDAVTQGPCLLPYAVVKVDPASMKSEVVFKESGPPMGYSTVALKVGDQVFMGSAHGDRVASRSIVN